MPSIEITGYEIEKANVVYAGVDETLSIAGRAADAKVTGDGIRGIESQIGTATLATTDKTVNGAINEAYSVKGVFNGNLLTLETPGVYRVSFDCTNKPVTNFSGMVMVFKTNQGTVQHIYTDNYGTYIWSRFKFDNGVWKEATPILTQNSALSLEEIQASTSLQSYQVTQANALKQFAASMQANGRMWGSSQTTIKIPMQPSGVYSLSTYLMTIMSEGGECALFGITFAQNGEMHYKQLFNSTSVTFTMTATGDNITINASSSKYLMIGIINMSRW